MPSLLKIDTKMATADSYIDSSDSNVVFNVFSGKNSLYTSTKTGKDAADDFLEKTDFLSHGLSKDLKEGRTKEETGMQHFYYYQTIHSIPVYGSSIAVHIKNGNQIYGADGNVIKDQTVGTEKISEQQAGNIALKQAQAENPGVQITPFASEKVILNKKVLGLDSDTKNYLTLAVEIKGGSIGSEVDVIYFVDLDSGEVLYTKANTHEELHREVRNPQQCTSAQSAQSCQLRRNEGGQPTGDKDADTAYDLMGSVYSYFKNTFGQDSYDNAGGVITIFPHISLKRNGQVTTDCRNAYWSIQGRYMAICDNMVANDVLGHEFTHGITASTANLEYMAQSGAINEAMSDIMATGVDPDWNIGEDTILGVVRSMDNPPAQNFPDRLFSQLYTCPPSGTISKNYCVNSNDYCGVHKNSGIMNKTFYLMVQGGSFNGCQLQGIGWNKAYAIMFRALTVYLNQTSNLRDVYTAVNQACSDLYNENTCNSVKSAMQSTEIDQQTPGSQIGPRCYGKTAEKPACAGDTSTAPTSGSQPTSAAQPTNSSHPTSGTNPTSKLQATTNPGDVDTSGCKPKYKPDKYGCEQPTLYTPNGVEGPGPVTFTWCASKPQQGFNFRLDINSDNQGQPDVVKDRMPGTSITVNVPKGKHAWWVHTFCDDGKNGYLTTASGRTLEVKDIVQNNIKKGPVTPSNTPTPVLSPTSMPGGAQQRVFQ